MSLHPATMLALVLCLGQKTNTQDGSLPSPTIDTEPGLRDAEPALKIPRGSSITFVCSNPDGYDVFRLEKNKHILMDKKNIQPPTREARFCFSPVNESIAGLFNCIYTKGSMWSPRSKTVEVKVISEDVTLSPAPRPSMTSDSETQDHTVENLIRIGMAGLILIILGILLFESWHSQREIHHSTESHQSE